MISGFRKETVALPIILLITSPIPIGLQPGFLSRGNRRPATYALKKSGFMLWVFNFRAVIEISAHSVAGVVLKLFGADKALPEF